MSVILSLYSQAVYKEILLPAVNNADHSVILNKNTFSLQDDIVLKMEIVDHQWHFLKDDGYAIYKNNAPFYGQTIHDKDMLLLTDQYGRQLTILVRETQNSFTVYKKYSLNHISQLIIGNKKNTGAAMNYDYLGLVSKTHATLFSSGGQWLIRDGSRDGEPSSNGVFINNIRMKEQRVLCFGDQINILGLQMIFLGNVLAVDDSVENLKINESLLEPLSAAQLADMAGKSGFYGFLGRTKNYFHRVPRNIEGIDDTPVEIEAPPAPPNPVQQSVLMTIGPSLTMAVPMLLGCVMAIVGQSSNNGSPSIFMFTGLVTAVTSAIIGTIWALVNISQQKKNREGEEHARVAAYDQYLDQMVATIREKYEKNGTALLNMYRPAAEYASFDRQNPLLWNRNSTHRDFLYHRLGIGVLPFQTPIIIPKERFTVRKDELASRPAQIRETYKNLQNVPVGVDLMEHPLIGIIGGQGMAGAYEVAQDLILQIGANNCYTDVKIGLVYDRASSREAESLGCVKWLPHVWSEDKKVRFVADDPVGAADVFYELARVLRQRAENQDPIKTETNVPKPWYVLFITDPDVLEGELIAKYLLEPEAAWGVTTILLVERYEQLPNSCEFIIQNDGEYKGIYSVRDDRADRIPVVFDKVDNRSLGNFTRRLSSIEVNEVETGGEIPASLTFFEMMGVETLDQMDVASRWRKNRTYDSMKAVIGQKAGGAPVYLDIHEKFHGPHGLVAGTTGSGKSETLQTYILSLAVNFSPDDIGFFIIDYKGGGMANLFEHLPHMMGTISNLSGNQVHRAMVSIKSENRRRQQIFNEHGVNNINQYTRLVKNNEATLPVPHLFIIIDEFAELKREEPDFMRELISVAQVGRSLGVHLILATQKPSGTVDDNIWSNSKFRLCLRVQDKQDSNDMLHKPDAAYITQAGRCYLQVGNDELYELFQSGFSGAVYDDSPGAGKTDIARLCSLNGKAALVGNRIKIRQKEARKYQWLCQLASMVRDFARRNDYDFIHPLDSDMIQRACQYLFKRLKEQHLDYPENEYNTRRLEEFLQIYRRARSSSTNRVESIVDRIIEISGEENLKLPEMKEKTQLDAVVEYLERMAAREGYTHKFVLWLPVLPQKLYLKDLAMYAENAWHDGKWPEEGAEWSLKAVVGLCDDPVNQAQMPLVVDFAQNGHHAVCGTVVTGKSTFLQTVIYSLAHRYSPTHVNIYAIDFSSHMLGAFEDLAHVGGVLYENDTEKIARFFNMMAGILKERKSLLQGGNYEQYVKTHGVVLPAILLVIDQYSAFREKTANAYEDILIQLSRDGASYGIYLLISSAGFGPSEIQSRIGDNIRTVICLEMGDKFQYSEAMHISHLEVLPEAGVKGRGLALCPSGVLEFQTALCLEAQDDYSRNEEIIRECQAMNESYTGRRARPVPQIPQKPEISQFMALEDVEKAAKDPDKLPMGYNEANAQIYSVDLSRTFCYIISGKTRSGKTNVLKVLAYTSALKENSRRVVIDFSGRLKGLAETIQAQFIDDDIKLYTFWEKLLPEFVARNKKKRSAADDGLDDREIFEKMQEEPPYFIFIDRLTDFVEHVQHPAEGVGAMIGFMENITDKGSLHNVFMFACMNPEDTARLAGIRLYENMVRNKWGCHLGGNVSGQRLLNFDYIPFTAQGKPKKPGIAMIPSTDGEAPEAPVVIVPQVRR